MPRRETRQSIERALAGKRRRARVSVEVILTEFGLRRSEIEAIVRRNSRRRPPGMAPALVEPPHGPLPLQGGAAAPLEFDN
jgi:hypothetical protein